jgi:hypothetical protein
MDAGVEQLAHASGRNRHCRSLSPVEPPQGKSVLRAISETPTPERPLPDDGGRGPA